MNMSFVVEVQAKHEFRHSKRGFECEFLSSWNWIFNYIGLCAYFLFEYGSLNERNQLKIEFHPHSHGGRFSRTLFSHLFSAYDRTFVLSKCYIYVKLWSDKVCTLLIETISPLASLFQENSIFSLYYTHNTNTFFIRIKLWDWKRFRFMTDLTYWNSISM